MVEMFEKIKQLTLKLTREIIRLNKEKSQLSEEQTGEFDAKAISILGGILEKREIAKGELNKLLDDILLKYDSNKTSS